MLCIPACGLAQSSHPHQWNNVVRRPFVMTCVRALALCQLGARGYIQQPRSITFEDLKPDLCLGIYAFGMQRVAYSPLVKSDECGKQTRAGAGRHCSEVKEDWSGTAMFILLGKHLL